MIRGFNDAHTCTLNGWQRGTILQGMSGPDPIYLKITAIGEERVLVRFLDSEFGPVSHELFYSLTMNDWARVLNA